MIDISWRRGLLDWKWHDAQISIDAAVGQAKRGKFFVLCSRRIGKTHYLLSRLFARGLRQQGARLLFLAPWAKDAADIANDVAQQILEDCPKDIRPVYNSQLKEFHFPSTGSVLRLKGVNGEHARFLRGGAQDEIVLDEVGQMDGLRSVVSDVCMPMLMTTGGLLLMATTPPESPGHDAATLYEELAGEGAAVKLTLLDAPDTHVSPEAKGKALLEAGEKPDHIPLILAGKALPKTTTARREYFCEFVTDASLAVVPEYDDEARAAIRVETQRPPFFDTYVCMDPGMKDRTGVLFAYWDSLRAKLVVEDELLLDHPNTQKIADAIRAKEKELWGEKTPYLRVLDSSGDGGLRLIADLRSQHGLHFTPARKDDSLAAIMGMRQSVNSRELRIDPRAKHLDRQLRNVIWNNKATDFARAGEHSIDGHYDLVAALKYLVRHVNRKRNPYPAHYYDPGAPLGPPKDSYVSLRNRRKRDDMGLFPNTPVGKKLAKKRRR